MRGLTETRPVLGDRWGVSPDAYAIRPIRPSDKEALLRFHARLSADARYRRYHGLKGDLTPAELQFLTEIDEVTHVARVAVDHAGEIDAVARVVDGEIAVVVADGRRRAGLGQRVVDAVVRAFREQGRGARSPRGCSRTTAAPCGCSGASALAAGPRRPASRCASSCSALSLVVAGSSAAPIRAAGSP